MNFKPPPLLFERTIPGVFFWDAFFMSRGSINLPGNVESTTQPEQHLGKDKMKFEHHKLQLFHIMYVLGKQAERHLFFSKVYGEYYIADDFFYVMFFQEKVK